MTLLILRLHPVEPISGDAFTAYLDGLSITAFDLTTASPGGVQVGDPAEYVSPPNPAEPWVPDGDTRIVQHFIPPEPIPTPPEDPQPQAVATAVIEVPAGGPEHATADLRLEISRGAGEIVHRQLHYNVPVMNGSLPSTSQFPELGTTSLFLPLPEPGRELDDDDAVVELPAEGTPPSFADLLGAVQTVLSNDPGGPPDIAALTPQQARHIANEIVWNQKLRPLPRPRGATLEQLYTDSDDDFAQQRTRFEGELQAYHAAGSAEAERMTGYVSALVAAVNAEALSGNADRVGFLIPVRPGATSSGARVKSVRVVLTGPAAPLATPFTVPAAIFYALGATTPAQVTVDERYRRATLAEEEHTRTALRTAVDSGVLVVGSDGTIDGVTAPQAARRLRALGAVRGTAPEFALNGGDPARLAVQALVAAWLDFTGDDITAFWDGTLPDEQLAGHLELVLRALTEGHQSLIDAIRTATATWPAVQSVDDIDDRTDEQWRGLFGDPVNGSLLPPFTAPGNAPERVAAFIRHVQKFFGVASAIPAPDDPVLPGPPLFPMPAEELLTRFVEAYDAAVDPDFTFGGSWVEADLLAAAQAVLPDDRPARDWLIQAVRAIDELTRLAQAPGIPAELAFSVMEGLYARGFTNRGQVAARSLGDFRCALTGTVAYPHAAAIHEHAGGSGVGEQPDDGSFQPVNPDGCLVNCVPPAHLSPLGPVAYLHELLQLTRESTCAGRPPSGQAATLGQLLSQRRGPLGDLLASRPNLETPLPLIDLVNESLEAIAADPTTPAGAVHQTNGASLDGHSLDVHDPATLFAALPEHSTPATPVAAPTAYEQLRKDFSAPGLPYAQSLDVTRTYLARMRTSRYAVLRRFRKDITELVLDPANEPAGFQRHSWRYPVRIDIAREYLGVNPEEYDLLFTQQITGTPAGGRPALRELYGFASNAVDGVDWKLIVVRLSEFLPRTGLSYCEFRELWESRFVEFKRAGADPDFPNCEPCHLDEYLIEFVDPADPVGALRQLAVFIRLWRKLRTLPGAGYGFAQLRDICVVLGLFDGGGTINPDFIRQLAAFQILRDRFRPELTDPHDPPAAGAVDAERTQLLAVWAVPPAAKRAWAVDELLDRVQYYAQDQLHCGRRPPEFRKLLEENLPALSELAGFDPGTPVDTWFAKPAHTLRFLEVLAKIYASEFGVGEVLYLCTTDPHLRDDDPFPLQPPNEALDAPLGLPDDERNHSLAALRAALLAVHVSDEEAASWTWDRIDATLRERFGFAPPAGGPDPLLVLGQHFFPSVLEAAGFPVPRVQRQYRVGLTGTSPPMWNTPPGPFRYDLATQELFVELPLSDAAVIAKLGRIRQLGPAEQAAVRELYFAPRADLVPFAFLFADFGRAENALVQEPDEHTRWRFFQHEFARAHTRAETIAGHLAAHVAAATGRAGAEGSELAWTLLRALYADENRATRDWEDDAGTVPPVTWPDRPSGGAFAALLGLVGTGLLGELTAAGSTSVGWREVRGPMDAFGAARNDANTPIPTVLPDLGLTLTPNQQDFVNVSNGFFSAAGNGMLLGGGQGFTVVWTGALLVDEGGSYEFRAGAPTPDGAAPDPAAAADQRWRVRLRRGQRSWVVLSRDWPDETAPPDCAELALRPGAYDLTVELTQPSPEYQRREDVCPIHGGFQVKYAGPDSGGTLVAIPHERLFRISKDRTLVDGVGVEGAPQRYLRDHYGSTLRDIRRTYQRAFKALLLAHRLSLSAQPVADDGQSEIGYLLAHADDFAGIAYPRAGAGFAVHLAFFDPNLLPLGDNYLPPAATEDQRVQPSPRRRQALFDWWERLFDYTVVRRETATAPEPPLWLLFHENAENHPDLPAHLRRHLDVEPRHVPLVLRHYRGFDVTGDDLTDERWTVRLWHADRWLRALRAAFLEADIRAARPDLWASNDPGIIEPGESESGNDNLTTYVRNGCIENGDPRRYRDIAPPNDGLRRRGRDALLAYLCGMDRVPLPGGGTAVAPGQLSELLLLDVQAGGGQRASRIEEAITAVQTFVQRARLGLEPAFLVSPAFALLWDRRFASYRIWEACTRRVLYRENWIDWDELERARRGEAFRFLTDELRRRTLTVPVAGGLEYWPDRRPPGHPGLRLLQAREPAQIRRVDPDPHGFDLLGTPERHARPSWLAALGLPDDDVPVPVPVPVPDGDGPDGPVVALDEDAAQRLPWWIQAAIRLGVRFVRVAAAGVPPASTAFEPRPAGEEPACCVECERPHPAAVDEYYFWLLDAQWYAAREQLADDGNGTDPGPGNPDGDGPSVRAWSWHDPALLPKLLHWPAEPAVHLAWCRVHNGELGQPRRSTEGVLVDTGDAQLVLGGRAADSLRFEVVGGRAPEGYPDTPAPGFRYDLPTDTAVSLPQVVVPEDPDVGHPGGLPAHPYFAYFAPGVPVLPPSLFAPAIAVAGSLRAHCQFEAALKWYELAFAPLHADSTWLRCPGEVDGGGEPVPRAAETGLCCQDSTAATESEIRDRSIVLHYLDTLLDWGDALLRRNTPESTQQARLIIDTASRLLGRPPRTVLAADPAGAPATVAGFVAHHPPLNPRLLGLYQRTADRLALLRAGQNAARLPIAPSGYWGDTARPDGWRDGAEPCLDEADWCAPPCPYRFTFLVQKAQELASEVRGLGAALLAAHEKGDAEYLASLRSTHERQLLELALEVRQNQWREADWQLQAMQKVKEIAQTRHRYYTLLIQNGLSNREHEHVDLIGDSLVLRALAQVSESIAQAVGVNPDAFVGFLSFTWIAGGTKMTMPFAAAARVSNILADIENTTAGLRLTEAGWERREEEWRHQVEVLDVELQQIERQILAAERRRDIALRELSNHQRQIEQSAEVQDFLRDKFTNHALYLFLQQDTAALHAQMYELALHTARQAQRAFNYERGHTDHTFVTAETWDHLREGLQAGERLQLGLRQMEHAYLGANTREYELTKNVSLRLHSPLAFLQLQATGQCEIDIPEWMFDLDYPGHYLRRIKNVTLTVPAVVGPYTGVHCRLTLLRSTTRVHPQLADPPHACCPDGRPGNGYPALLDDARMVNQYAATEAIATSGGQNDAGLFELSFRDERYLPFEFAGAVSRWRIELPPENNQFDLDTVADMVLHLNYTAREGGELLRRAANEIAQRFLPGAGMRYFDVQRDMADAWHRFRTRAQGAPEQQLPLRLSQGMFPFLTGQREVRIRRIELLFEVANATPDAHQLVGFEFPAPTGDRGSTESYRCDIREIRCVASADRPSLYHGVLDDTDLGPLSRGAERELGLFRFTSPSEITRVFLLCRYEAHVIRASYHDRPLESTFQLACQEWNPASDKATRSRSATAVRQDPVVNRE